MSSSSKFVKHYPKIPGYRLIKPRRCQVFGVGSPKTGTHSLTGIFENNFRALHEAEVKQQIELLLRHRKGLCHPGEIRRWFVDRSHRLWLDCDVSHLHGHFVADIAEAIPEAKFILTLREPRSWLDSAFNQTLGRPVGGLWAALRTAVYGEQPDRYPEQEKALQALGLYSISQYLDRWAERIERVTAAIPQEQLLILKTRELENSEDRIADFCGVDRQLLSTKEAHRFPAAKKAGVLDGIDKDYLEGLIHQRCGVLLQRYFT